MIRPLVVPAMHKATPFRMWPCQVEMISDQAFFTGQVLIPTKL
jgi:hypothetical protein